MRNSKIIIGLLTTLTIVITLTKTANMALGAEAQLREKILISTENVQADLIQYKVDDGYLIFNTKAQEIVGGELKMFASVTIPQEINGVPVLGIGKEAFVSYKFKTLVLPDGLQYIGNDAFCESLVPIVRIPDSVKVIGGGAFGHCWGENQIIMGKGVEEIGNYAFFESNTRDMILPDTLKSIGISAFEGSAVSELIIPDSVKSIGDSAFAYSAMKNLTIGKGTTIIGKELLDATEKATVFVEKDSYAYKYVNENNLRYKLIGEKPSDWTEFVTDGGLLKKYTGRDSVVFIPEDLHDIAPGAFGRNLTITKVVLPENMVEIGTMAFEGCTNLTEVVFPKDYIKFKKDAFANTKWLSNQKKENPLVIVNDLFLVDGHNVTGKVTIPKGVVVISEGTFEGNNKITQVNIPNTMVRIEEAAFAKCKKLTKVRIPSSVKEISSDAFSKTPKTMILHVEEDSKAHKFAKKNKLKYKLSGDSNSKTADEYIKIKIKSQDTLWNLSRKYLNKGSRYMEIMKLNGLKNTTLYVGQTIKVPVNKK